jgi:hypothetical protein
MSSLTRSAATLLGMRLRNSGKMHLFSREGAAVRGYYMADSFQLGPLMAKKIPFVQSANDDDALLSGTMGPDLMVRYDVEMDFSEQKLSYFSQDHCPGHIVHWSSDAVTQVPIRVAPRARDYPPPLVPGAIGDFSPDFVAGIMAAATSPILGTDIRANVMLDGHLFTANIATALPVSTINSEAARDYFDVPLDDLGSEVPNAQQNQTSQANSGTETVTVTGYRGQHRFHTLTFGGVTVINPLFVLSPVREGAHRVGAPRSPDVTIGMNVLRKLHLYFAFGERMLYISPATSHVGVH